MTNNIFSQYQRKNLLPPLGGDDTIYTKLQEATKAIAEDLSQNSNKIPTYALVAFDNQITDTEPVLLDVEMRIQEHWQMVRSKFTEMPIALYRAIIIQAFEHLITDEDSGNDNFATIVYLSVSDVFPYINIAQQEREVLTTFLQEVSDSAEELAISEWSVHKTEVQPQITELKIKLNQKNISIDLEVLKTKMMAAAGPNKINGIATNGNRYWPQNNAQHWLEDFGKLSAEAITEEVNKALNSSDISSVIQSGLNTFLKSLNSNLQTAFEHNIQSAVAVEQRSQLLWWKETMYSQKLRKSYRKLSKLECAIAMAVDLYEILPNIYPISVDYILREAFWQIHGRENGTTMIDFLNEINDSKNEAFLKNYFEEIRVQAGRTDLVSFLRRIIHSRMNIKKELPASIGIDASTKITYDDISVWILHCFSVHRLTQN